MGLFDGISRSISDRWQKLTGRGAAASTGDSAPAAQRVESKPKPSIVVTQNRPPEPSPARVVQSYARPFSNCKADQKIRELSRVLTGGMQRCIENRKRGLELGPAKIIQTYGPRILRALEGLPKERRLELLRHALSGPVAKKFFGSGVKLDKVLRTLGINPDALANEGDYERNDSGLLYLPKGFAPNLALAASEEADIDLITA